jgi:hypothetical protein
MTTTVDGFIAKPDGTLWHAFPKGASASRLTDWR